MRRRALIKRVRIGVFIAWRSLLVYIHMADVLADNLLASSSHYRLIFSFMLVTAYLTGLSSQQC